MIYLPYIVLLTFAYCSNECFRQTCAGRFTCCWFCSRLFSWWFAKPRPLITISRLRQALQTAPQKLHCNVTVNTPASPGTTVHFIVDTGSSVSILPLHIYKRCFSATQLSTPSIRLVTYTQECIPVLGCLQAQACLSIASAVATFFIVDKGTALLSMDLISALKL